MAVGNIVYKNVLDTEDLTPKKLESLYSTLINDLNNLNSTPTDTQLIDQKTQLLPRDMVSSILNNRQNKETVTEPINDSPVDINNNIVTESVNNSSINTNDNIITEQPINNSSMNTNDNIVTKNNSAVVQPVTSQAIPFDYTPTYITNGKSGINLDRARYWFKEFDKYGMTPLQKVALIVAMNTECGLNPIGSVNKRELNEGLNTKGGWAHAGEAAFGLTHWSTKKKYIDLYNADPRRKGPKLSNIEFEYANPNARHIANLSDEDHGLLTNLYYKSLIDRTKGETDLRNLVAEFYLQKAGRGNVTGNTAHEKAVAKGKSYMKSHAKQGFTKASQTNQYLKSLDRAVLLAKELGVIV